jgi:hypothetical protein
MMAKHSAASPSRSPVPNIRHHLLSKARGGIPSLSKNHQNSHGMKRSARRLVQDWSSIAPGETHRSRYLDHYRHSLSADLLYLTYKHDSTLTALPPPPLPQWKDIATNPYAQNRPRPPTRQGVQPNRQSTDDKNLVRIEKLVLSTHVKQAPSPFPCSSLRFMFNRSSQATSRR